MAQDAPAKPLSRNLILGSWRMRSWVTIDVTTGERQDALGQNPRGTVVYTPERVVFLILKNNRARPEQLPPSDGEKITLFDTMFAYSGSYTVESDRVVHHVDLSSNEEWTGTDQCGSARSMSIRSPLHRPPARTRSTGRSCSRGDMGT